MPNRNYKVGYALENDLSHILESENYYVTRSAGSHKIADLVALKTTTEMPDRLIDAIMPFCEVTMIQCKRHKNLMTQKEIQDFKTKAQNLITRPAICWRDNGIYLLFLDTNQQKLYRRKTIEGKKRWMLVNETNNSL